VPPPFELVGPNRAVAIYGVKLVGVTAENGLKLLVSVGFAVAIILVARLLRRFSYRLLRHRDVRTRFWVRQGIGLGSALVLLVGLASIWFDDPSRLTTALGLLSAGLAFALQRVVTAIAGYFVILRGRTFNVGDRILMGGVRGDVIGLGFVQTQIMEMGQPPSVTEKDSDAWVRSRQYTGRVVAVTNEKIFTEPVYNYTREFPYLWEELSIPLKYEADHVLAERILLEAAERHSVAVNELSEQALAEMQRRYFVERAEIRPRVFYRITDNWLELTVRHVVPDHAIREIKDRMSREILSRFREAGIEIASATVDVVGVPPVRIEGGPR